MLSRTNSHHALTGGQEHHALQSKILIWTGSVGKVNGVRRTQPGGIIRVYGLNIKDEELCFTPCRGATKFRNASGRGILGFIIPVQKYFSITTYCL